MRPELSPDQFAFRPLDELVAALERADPGDAGLNATEVTPHGPSAGVTRGPGHGLVSTNPGETRLPLDHPPIEIPSVALEAYLGGGGQGWVYVGRIRSTQKIVAVKVLARGRDSLDWGAREAILAARVRHPNVLRVLRAQPAGAFWVVVMEFVQGEELGSGRLPAAATEIIFAQLADAVAALARCRLVHRDIKPANVILRRDDRSPVLIDFGLAVDLAEADEHADLSGTPFFLPPEAWRDAPPTPAWDAYSLGVTAAVALAGAPAMPTDLPTLRVAKLSGVFERRILHGLPDDARKAWISELIAADPARRLAAIDAARRWAA
jgi:serine/threonine-protein kinase